jgi:glycosidase
MTSKHASSLALRWWETTSAMIRPYLKARGKTLGDLLDRLDDLKSQGFDAIEVFAPCAGGVCYNGLDTIDFYAVDPALGSMADFQRLVSEAHAHGMALIVFLNLGYAHEQFPAFLKACDDVRACVDSPEARMFCWSDTGSDVMDKPLAPYFLNDSHGNWRWSERAQKYFWVKWEGEHGGYHLPQLNFGDPGWQAEVKRILDFWLGTGVDGVVIDAVNWYIDCDWTITRDSMTNVINAYDNQFSQPEGAGGFRDDPLPWISQGGFNCVMDYAIKLWWEGLDVIGDAVRRGDPRPIEAALRGYRDRVAEAGGVCYIDTPDLRDAPVTARLLGIATVATIGELLLAIGDAHLDWSEEQQRAVTALLAARRQHPALCAGGTRTQLPTSDDSRFYAFTRAPRRDGRRMLIVLNFQPQARQISIDLRGAAICSLEEIWSRQQFQPGDTFSTDLPGYGYRIFAIE